MAKQTLATIVAQNLADLQGKSCEELLAWSRAHDINNGPAFASFKRALLAHGIDYDAMRDRRNADQADALASAVTHEITLYSDAKVSRDRYGIVDATGAPVWYGRFFENDHVNEQSQGERAAALKAIWLAGRIREQIGSPAVRLHLRVDAEWLTTLSGKAKLLADQARKFNVDLDIVWVSGKANPADVYTICSGYQSYKEYPIETLAIPVTAETEVAS